MKETERKAIAREIHDDIGGLLTGLSFDLAWLQHHAQGDKVAERLQNMQALLDQARDSVQRILRELRPPMLELGVVAALEWQAQDFSRRYGIPCHFVSNRETIAVSEAISGALFRICQEALTNIAKHARAQSVNIDVFADASSVTLEVTDDGVGLAADSLTKAGSYGLLGMRERAANLNGWIEVNSTPGRGTSLMLSLPLPLHSDAGSAP
jgi:two-component system sensor histidine kinase UhpB